MIQNQLLQWFDENRRRLPWRERRSAYTVWIAEIMLQQTRVDTVIPYFTRWLERFPDMESLAMADEQEVLTFWEGLGYYSRARTLLKTARIIFEEENGIIPSDPEALAKLPGIGRYTAGAIASIAYGVPAAALDGNIRRILARVYDVETPVRQPETEKRLWALAEELLDRNRPGDFNEALMDFGSAVCLPSAPHCSSCPITEYCSAFNHGTVAERPVIIAAAPIPHYIVTAAVIHSVDDHFLLARRPEKGLLGGLWEFPGGKVEPGETLEECLHREIFEELGTSLNLEKTFGVYNHAYTHFKITLHAFLCTIDNQEPKPKVASALAWVIPDEMETYPMGKVDRMIANRLLKGCYLKE